jgi:micrococcal nuclease
MARWLMLMAALVTGCTLNEPPSGGPVATVSGQTAVVVTVIDGDTIDVGLADGEYRVRYLGVNSPERSEICYAEATDANRALVEGRTVTLVTDVRDTDDFGRLLRYVYDGETMVNEVLVRDGWAEAVLYPPDSRYYERFVALESEAAAAGRGCHPTGIYNDGSLTR